MSSFFMVPFLCVCFCVCVPPKMGVIANCNRVLVMIFDAKKLQNTRERFSPTGFELNSNLKKKSNLCKAFENCVQSSMAHGSCSLKR
jgi:hypothetical protein